MRTRQTAISQTIRVSLLTALVAGIVAGIPIAGCSDDLGDTTTSGQRLQLQVSAKLDEDPSLPHANAKGWSITLSKVAIAVGAVYFFDGAPPDLARSSPRAFWTPRVAHAHPGHYQEGNAMGQVLTPTCLDLAQAPQAIARGDGISGVYRSGSLRFQASGKDCGYYNDRVIVVEGSAQKGNLTRRFRASASAADLTNSRGVVGIDACVFDEASVVSDNAVVLTVKPMLWLDQVDFTELAASESAPVDLPGGSAAQQAFLLLGVSRASAYEFSLDPSQP